ncbi:DEAD/DEAH box helicase [Thalassotalea piscium]
MTHEINEVAGQYSIGKLASFTQQSQQQAQLTRILSSFGYEFKEETQVGFLFVHSNRPAIFVDTYLDKLSPKDYQYVAYTSYQNQLMHTYQGVYRFVWFDEKSFVEDVSVFLTDLLDDDIELAIYGANRELQHVDPTPPEFNFSVFFEQTFGEKAIHALQAECNYTDKEGHRRFIDFVLNTQDRQFAIELNGERYHHPLLISQKQYRSQLFKQNSLVYDGYLVYRWSDRGMADENKLSEQLKTYFGDQTTFNSTPNYKANRQVSFQLYPHQSDAIEKIAKQRLNGDNSFLVVLPTGTGKTEVFIEDVCQQLRENEQFKVLAVVPSKELKKQLMQRISVAMPNVHLVDNIKPKNSYEQGTEKIPAQAQSIFVVTSAYILRHYRNFPRDYFNYIVIDEAHRAAAAGLSNALAYFKPESLLGLTATPDRTDQQQLEKIFGEYDIDLTLAEAIEQGLVPPIRAFRLESNIDFSKVRFNGKEFVKQDLNKTVLIPSRNELIANVLKRYFSAPLQSNQALKQGVVFCVDVKHTKAMAKLLNKYGLSAVAVDGKNRDGIDQYRSGDVQFICACDLLNEGWDVPNTSVVVMARPTMSKVLYTQQLGRGTRKCEGKEALYVIDVVDAYGPSLSPWSVHSLLGLTNYQAFSDVLTPKVSTQTEIITLDGLFEEERRLEPINIFNFEKEFGDLLNEEQFARELFITTSTVKQWLKKGELKATKTIPFGNKTLSYFANDVLEEIRLIKKLKLRTEDTRRDDFFEFLAQRDYTFSYKIIFMLLMLKHCNDRGEIDLPFLVDKYKFFYVNQLQQQGKADKSNSPYNKETFLENKDELQKNLLTNPFEKFERKRFIYQSKDLNILSFDEVLWQKLSKTDIAKAIKQLEQDGIDYFSKLDITFDLSLLN